MNHLKIRGTARAIFYLNAVTWLVLGVVSLGKMVDGQAVPWVVQAIIAILMFGNAGAMFLAGWGLGRGSLQFYFLALAVITVNVLLTFTDQVGLLDWITLGIDLVLLVLLVSFRKVFLLKTG